MPYETYLTLSLKDRYDLHNAITEIIEAVSDTESGGSRPKAAKRGRI
jgi:hypothetical protein